MKGNKYMVTIKPFKAIRPAQQYSKEVISLPYDVMSRKEAFEMAKDKPYSFLHICRSEIDLPESTNPYEEAVYKKAKENIDNNLKEGIFIKEDKPCFYIYREIMDGRIQTGLVACASIDDYQNNVIKKHEFTRYEKELDRINHFDICNANTEPVFLTYRKNDTINDVIEKCTLENKPVYDIISDDNIRHIVWIINDENIINILSENFNKIESLYIADGHHRTASAVKVGLKRRENDPEYDGTEEFNFFLAVMFPHTDLKIFDYNRVVSDLNGLSESDFISKIKEKFFVSEHLSDEPYRPEKPHVFGMYLNNKWYKLEAKEDIVIKNDIIRRLDVSVLQEHILAPILGIEDPRKDHRIDFVGGIRGLNELEKRVHTDMKAAFALYPVSIEDLLEVSDNGLVMPPKSTWFEPKLGSGLFLHEL